MTINERSLIGKGLAFPLNQSGSKGLNYSDGVERINQSLFLLFETHKGSRLMLPEYGSDLHKYRFDPIDTVLMERLRYTITEDVKKWIPAIALTSIEFLTDEEYIDDNKLFISISYTIINTAISGNYVYPYRTKSYDTV